MMTFVITIAAACGVFALCFAVFLLKGRREGGPPRLHRCNEGGDCHCYEKSCSQQPFDVVQLLDKVKAEDCKDHQSQDRSGNG